VRERSAIPGAAVVAASLLLLLPAKRRRLSLAKKFLQHLPGRTSGRARRLSSSAPISSRTAAAMPSQSQSRHRRCHYCSRRWCPWPLGADEELHRTTGNITEGFSRPGRERVLCCVVRAVQELRPRLPNAVFTGDADASPDGLAARALLCPPQVILRRPARHC
jgi:hypothetical protein